MSFLFWLAAEQVRYAVAAGLPLLVLCVLAVAGMWNRRAAARLATTSGTVVFFACAALALLAARWPTLFVREPLNQDEAQALAQAITALRDPIPWHGFDGNTCGPLNTYVLMLPALFGAKLSFLTARAVALTLELGAAVALFAWTAIAFDRALARLAVVPVIAFFALSTRDHFVHYSGEHLSIFLAALALALLWRGLRGPGRAWLFAGGLVAGMLPFAKLQSLPLGALTVGVVAALLAFDGRRRSRAKVADIAVIAGGLALVPALILGAAVAAGTLRDFWISYVLTSLAYILPDRQPASFLLASAEFGPLFCVLLAVGVLGALIAAMGLRATSPPQRAAFSTAWLVLAGAVWAIYAPHRGSFNYLLFGVVPAATVAAAALGAGAAALPLRARGAVALGFVAAILLAERGFTRPAYPYLGALADYTNGGPDAVTALIATYVHPGERLAIWGWRPQYYVTTSTLLGTRDAITQYQYDPDFNPYFDYFRARYVADFQRNRPAGFLDAGADSFDFQHRGPDGYEAFPALAAVVNRDYRLAGSAKGIRLFVRRARAAS